MFTFSCLPVSQSGCSSVCPSHYNYTHFTKFCRRIKHACNKVQFSLSALSSDDAVYLNHFWQSDFWQSERKGATYPLPREGGNIPFAPPPQ